MNVVVIYDVSSNPAEIKAEMINRGYFSAWYVVGAIPQITYNLPHNVVWKKDIEMNAALLELQSIISNMNQTKNLNIVLQRCIIVPSTPWGGIPGIAI